MSTTLEYDKKRLETFVDAVLAIALTILVLEFRVPKIKSGDSAALHQALKDLIPSVISYILAFLTIVGLWIDHHHLFLHVKKVDKRYLFINCLFLLSASSLPFTTGLAGEYIADSLPVAIFAGNVLLMNLMFSIVFVYPEKKKWIEDSFFNKSQLQAVWISIAGLVLEVIAIPLAFVNTYLAISLIAVVLAAHILKR